MLIATLQKLNDEMVDEIVLGIFANNIEQLRSNLQNGVTVAVIAQTIDNGDGDQTHNYFDIVFADGTVCNGVSGLHLSGISNWK